MANKKEVRVPPKAGKVIDAKSVEGAANRARTSQLGSNGKTRELKYWRGSNVPPRILPSARGAREARITVRLPGQKTPEEIALAGLSHLI